MLADRTAPFTPTEIARLHGYVEEGGRLLIMDHFGGGPPLPPAPDPAHYHTPPATSTKQLLAHFGFALGAPQPEATCRPTEPLPQFSGIRLAGALAVQGGTPALVSEHGVPIVAVKSIGQGRVAVFGGSRLFAVASMGQPLYAPTEAQISIYRLEYWLFVQILGIGKW